MTYLFWLVRMKYYFFIIFSVTKEIMLYRWFSHWDLIPRHLHKLAALLLFFYVCMFLLNVWWFIKLCFGALKGLGILKYFDKELAEKSGEKKVKKTEEAREGRSWTNSVFYNLLGVLVSKGREEEAAALLEAERRRKVDERLPYRQAFNLEQGAVHEDGYEKYEEEGQPNQGVPDCPTDTETEIDTEPDSPPALRGRAVESKALSTDKVRNGERRQR